MASIIEMVIRAENAGWPLGQKQPNVNRRQWFGGTRTSQRRARCLAYAWRQHRKSGNPAPFWFSVTHSVFHDPRQGRDRSGRGKATPTRGMGRVIGFVTAKDRERARPFLRAMGYDYFVPFNDVNARFALQIGRTLKAEQAGAPTPQPLQVQTFNGIRFRP